MARTNATDVKLILESTVADSIIEAFISDANLLVTEVLGSSDLSSALLESIEKWLSAHMVALSPYERQTQKQKIDDAEDTYGKLGMNLEATTYGQMVLQLDTTGAFAALNDKKQKTKIVAVTSFS